MRYLLDTQIVIWALVSPEKLSLNTTQILQSNEIWVSQISLLEVVIKQKIGKLPELDLPVSVLIIRLEQDGFNLLPLHNRHIEAYTAIPLFDHHRAPFDRLLLATALSENMPIVSADENLDCIRHIFRSLPIARRYEHPVSIVCVGGTSTRYPRLALIS